jgi:hypothetical protein
MEMPDAKYSQLGCRESRGKLALNEISAEPIVSQNGTIKPVAIRRGFMLVEKLPILQCFDSTACMDVEIDCKLQSNSS